MSKINISGLIKNYKEQTSSYTPIIEAVVNSIQAIEDANIKNGEIQIRVKRSAQVSSDFEGGPMAEINSIEIVDNGIGFNEENIKSFDTVFSDYKIERGCKGFGRFIFLRHFDEVSVKSTFRSGDDFKDCSFRLGRKEDIIENKKIESSSERNTKTVVYLDNIKTTPLDKKIETFSRRIFQKILIYFVDEEYNAPLIKVVEGNKEIILNDYLKSENGQNYFQIIDTQEFRLSSEKGDKKFKVKTFKIFSPESSRSKIILSANNREVTSTLFQEYIPEFEEEFYEERKNEDGDVRKNNFIVRSYVLGSYLDEHVSLERNNFGFGKDNDLFLPFSRKDIEKEVAEIVRDIFPDEVSQRLNKKIKRINSFVNETAPWHRPYLDELDIKSLPVNLTDELIEIALHKLKFKQQVEVRQGLKKALEHPEILQQSIEDIMKKISDQEKSDLSRYVASRKVVLDLFKKSLERGDDGKYSSEDMVHGIIHPTKSDSDATNYYGHNLWILDERLSFNSYLTSDKAFGGGNNKRGDVIVYNNKVAFRGENEVSNPVTVFEFKKPQREDFVLPSADDDPVLQIIRYVNDIKEGKFKTPEGRDIKIADNTPFYAYLVVDVTKKVEDWLIKTHDFKPMPDNQGWFIYKTNINLYLEVLTWDKILNDSIMRNKILFDKLNI